MFRFGLKNLRRLQSVKPIELRRITVLVGRNSSGKSTFLRSIPLLRQSVTTRIRSPLLWWSEDVDFGSFEGAVYSNDISLPIGFSFGLDKVLIPEGYLQIRRGTVVRTDRITIKGILLEVDVSLGKGTAHTPNSYISTVQILFEETSDSIKMQMSETGALTSFMVNDVNAIDLFNDYEIRIVAGSIVPLFSVSLKKRSGSRSDFSLYYPGASESLMEKYEEVLTKHARRNPNPDGLTKLAVNISRIWPFNVSSLASTLEKTNLQAWKRFARELLEGNHVEFYDDLKRISLCSKVFRICRTASEEIRMLATRVMYIGPARARSERYYRYQDLAVSQIDANGKNFPMFLNYLSTNQVKSLSRWIENLFGYGVDIDRTSGHISIALVHGGARRNIVDTGYGVSQILPVLGQIWWAYNSPKARSEDGATSILAIEQPELHLHPAHQALLANALIENENEPVSSGTPNSRSVKLLIETHSEAFINRLGELIGSGLIKSEDVQVLLFEDDEKNPNATNVRVSHFDRDGSLINWPYGFFQPAI